MEMTALDQIDRCHAFSHISGTCGEKTVWKYMRNYTEEEGDTGAVGTEGSKWVNIMETHTLYH